MLVGEPIWRAIFASLMRLRTIVRRRIRPIFAGLESGLSKAGGQNPTLMRSE